MEKKMMMPASYNVMTEEEMTYTQGGADFGGAVLTVVNLAVGAVFLYNYIWGLNETRNWLKKNKTNSVITTVQKASSDTMSYLSSSLFNTVRGIVTAMQFTALWPITAVAWLTVA